MSLQTLQSFLDMVCTLRCLFCKHIFYMKSASQVLVPSVRSKCLWSKDTIITFHKLGQTQKRRDVGMFTSRHPNHQICFCGCLLCMSSLSVCFTLTVFLPFLRIKILWITEIKALRVFIADRFFFNTTFWPLLKISQV